MVPGNTGGFGAATPAVEVFAPNIEPLPSRFRELNAWIGEEFMRLTHYQSKSTAAPQKQTNKL